MNWPIFFSPEGDNLRIKRWLKVTACRTDAAENKF